MVLQNYELDGDNIIITKDELEKCEEIFGVPAVILMMMYDIKKLEEE